ncbi:MAG TPA: hypothetical protein ENN80_07550, partial [Candidatus Hydrogenedentes bacterium]|nr:hypothetical protein [Candidatus Hydrogenedentota bacterium]
MLQRLLPAVLLIITVGCQTTERGMHHIPVPRHYGKLAEQDIDESAALVAHARRLGAPANAPYEFYSAEAYLALARRNERAGDKAGAWDYAALAKRM